MNWDKFHDKFHESWHPKIRPFIESAECDGIYDTLKKESARGKKIAPLSSDVFRAFKETPYDDVKVVLMGMCPYHTIKGGEYVADGLLMGCSHTETLQPSLDQFYNALEKDVYNGLNLKYVKTPDVRYLAHQGVLMLNAALTTEINKAGSHIALWQPFTEYLFTEAIALTQAPVVFLGKDAAKYTRFVAPFIWTFTLSHPASAAYSNTEWSSEGTFTNVNKILKDNNGWEINWLYEEPPF
jgi:uracil-DNA glycosylase